MEVKQATPASAPPQPRPAAPEHAPAPPAGILPSRGRAQAALLRIFSRARRQQRPLLLVSLTTSEPAAWLAELATDWRIGDLAWREPKGRVMALFEDVADPAPLLERLRAQARAWDASVSWRWAQFPQQGVTLEALFDQLTGEAKWGRH